MILFQNLFSRICIALLILAAQHLNANWAIPANLINPATPGQPADQPQVAVDASGNAIIVFTYIPVADSFIYAATYKKSTSSLSAPIPISPALGLNPQVAVDNAGNGVAVWVDSGSSNILASTYDFASNTWSASVILNVSPGNNANNPQIAVDKITGNAVAVWQEQAATLVVYAANYDFATATWSSPATIVSTNSPGNTSFNPQIGIDDSGNAIVVWNHFFLDTETEFVRYDAGTMTWSTPVVIPSSTNSNNPIVAVAANGNAVALWTIFDGTAINVRGSSYNAGTNTWTTSGFLISPSVIAQNASSPSIGVDAVGNASAVWVYITSAATIIQEANFDLASLTWSTPINLTTPVIPGQDAISPKIAVEPNGDAVAIWTYNDGTAFTVQAEMYHKNDNIWFNRFNIIRNSVLGQDATTPVIGVDPYGNAVAAWVYSEIGTTNIQASVLNVPDPDVSTVVANPTHVANDGVTFSTITVTLLDHYGQPVENDDVSLVANSGGSVISAPSGQSNGSGIVTFTVTDLVSETVLYTATDDTAMVTITQQASVRFGIAPPPPPPQDFKGKVVKNVFLTQTSVLNVLRWKASADAVGYRLYQNGILIKEIGVNGPFEVAVPRRRHTSYLYKLVAVNVDGIESTPVFVNL